MHAAATIAAYPEQAKSKLQELHKLILAAAYELEQMPVEESLKWGEPAYLSKHGSTIRIDWKAKSPDKVWVFFNCKSLLLETFRELYRHELTFSGNRAIELNLHEPLPKEILSHCFSMALNYHKVKHLPLLGANHAPS